MTDAHHDAADPDRLHPGADDLSAQELLAWACAHYEGRITLTCSWQMQSSVLVDMLWRLGARVRIVQIDTGLLHPETHDTRRALIARYGIHVESALPTDDLATQAEREGERLWARDPDRCCALRKVAPLREALSGQRAWITGIRREQSPARAGARALHWDPQLGLMRVQPLAGWTHEDLLGYLYAHDVPFNSLHERGYPSIGCIPCTAPVGAGEDPRAGRWAGRSKSECGLHAGLGGSRVAPVV